MLNANNTASPSEDAGFGSEKPEQDSLDKISQSTRQAILNILTESPFFYAGDDPMRFTSLRRNETAFRKFFEKYFGWRLYVDAKMARLIKDQNFNPALKPLHRVSFRLTTRNECLLFLMLLEFYEHECNEQGYSYDDLEPLRFTYADFLSFARRSCNEHLADKSPSDRELDAIARQLLRKLQQYRLLRVTEVEEKAADGDNQNMLIEALPGLNCYEGRKMAEAVVKTVFSEVSDLAAENFNSDASENAEDTEENNGEDL